MAKFLKNSVKALEADIEHANSLALCCRRKNDGACIQMRLSYSPAAQAFLCLVQWADCQLAAALGLLQISICMNYADGKTTKSAPERKTSIREFYSVIYPSLLQLQSKLTDFEDRRQKEICSLRYSKNDDFDEQKLSEIEQEKELECGICMKIKSKVVLPTCTHSLCLTCFHSWYKRSKSCPFCRDSLTQLSSNDLWIYMDGTDITDLSKFVRENTRRLFSYVEKLPLVTSDPVILPDHPS